MTAPLFGIAAGLLLASLGTGALASRWSMGTVAITHLLTAGFMLQAMFGALLQFIPVAAGGNVWRPGLLAGVVHPVVTAGAVLLCASFLWWRPDGLGLAAAALGAGSLGFAFVVGMALLRTTAASATVRMLRASVASLAVTVVLGAVLVEGMRGSLVVALVQMANLHAAWGLAGWGLLLLAAVSMYVVPMFQLTPFYPAWLGRALAPGMLASLLVLSILAATTGRSSLRAAAAGLGVLLAAVFAAQTLWLQWHRRRPRIDASFIFFRSAMFCLLAAAGSFVLLWTQGDPDPALQARLGVLVLVGVFASAINGMMYKIVPFLCSLHLQRIGKLPAGQSSMPQLSRRAVSGQLWLHLAALGLLLGATWLPRLAGAAGLAFAASCAWLEWNLALAVRRYLDIRARIRAGAASGGSLCSVR